MAPTWDARSAPKSTAARAGCTPVNGSKLSVRNGHHGRTGVAAIHSSSRPGIDFGFCRAPVKTPFNFKKMLKRKGCGE
eukprot:scaffold23_cov113-Isochrysis_galbana.AAC.12